MAKRSRVWLAALCACALATPPVHADEKPKPNLVVFLSDDHGYLDSTPYGAADVRTPNMKRLADAGCTFTHLFVASPSCAPSRAALLTGRMPARNGAEANHSKPRAEIKKLPAFLQALGYEVAAFGKVAHYGQAALYGFDHADKEHDAKVVEKYLDGRKAAKPLCLFVGTHAPHVPWPKNEGYAPEKLKLPPTHVDTPETRAFRAQYYTAVTRADRDLGAAYDLARRKLGKNTLFVYTSDHGAQWPFGKWNLYDAGLRVPLLAAWPGVIKPGTKSDALLSAVDLLPTFLDLAGGTPPKDLDGRSFADVLRGKKTAHRDHVFATHSGDGRMNVYPIRCMRIKDIKYIFNLHPEYEHTTHIDLAKPVDGVHYWRSWEAAAKKDPNAAAVVKRYRQRPKEELYDLKADPHEQKNLAADPKHAATLKKLRGQVQAWMKEQGDKGTVFDTPRRLGDREGKKPARPNVLIVLADDLGYSDLGCYGGEIKTPNLDALAANGLRFTQFYNCTRCCPTRASLLTGLYPHQAGVGDMTGDAGAKFPGYRGRLNDACVTLPEVLRAAGYRTYMVGKWHLTGDPGPIRRGFDEFYGMIGGFNTCWQEKPFYTRLPKGRAPRAYAPGKFYSTDVFADYALDFLADARKAADKPWLLYLAFNAPHFPLHAPEAEVAKYEKLYAQGWDKVREQRLKRMKELGIVAKDVALTPRGPVPETRFSAKTGWAKKDNPAWDALPAARRADLARRMAVYAGMVDRMDQTVGRVVADLKKNGELGNTLILFLSDNGACAEWDPWGFDGRSGPDNVLHTGEGLKKVGGPDSYVSYGSGWANACNTPLRLYKHYGHEGGISTPLIAHWPDRVRAKGELRREAGHVIDLMATCVGAAGAKYPATFKGNKITPFEGKSLLPAFAGKALGREMLAWEHEGNKAVRAGKWKLVARDGRPWELYDIEADRVEMRDLAAKHPERVKELAAKWEAWARRAHVFPKPGKK